MKKNTQNETINYQLNIAAIQYKPESFDDMYQEIMKHGADEVIGSDRYRTAIHEASHATMDKLLGLNVDCIEIENNLLPGMIPELTWSGITISTGMVDITDPFTLPKEFAINIIRARAGRLGEDSIPRLAYQPYSSLGELLGSEAMQSCLLESRGIKITNERVDSVNREIVTLLQINKVTVNAIALKLMEIQKLEGNELQLLLKNIIPFTELDDWICKTFRLPHLKSITPPINIQLEINSRKAMASMGMSNNDIINYMVEFERFSNSLTPTQREEIIKKMKW